MMLARLYQCGISTALVLSLLACGGGGGGNNDPAPTTPANVAGSWTVTETSTSNNCGDLVDPAYSITITQNGGNLSVSTPVGVFTGTINGSTVGWTGSYPEDGGTTTITSMTATVASSGNTFSGTSNWSWSGPGGPCSGSTTFTGTRIVTTVTIGGTISGLSGTVVLLNNGGNSLSRSSNGTFTFTTAINSGSTYNVTVGTQPSGQTCTVSNGSGTATANVTNVSVSCSSSSSTVGESEPNDSRANADIVTRPVTITGSAAETQAGENINGFIVQDWFQFTLASTTTVTITLTFSGSPTQDLDLWLMSNGAIVDTSFGVTGTETISRSLSAGTYQVGVEAFDTTTSVAYTLTIQ
jgi:hypothetical protein